MAVAAAEKLARAAWLAACVLGLGCGAAEPGDAGGGQTRVGANGVDEFEAWAQEGLAEGRNEFVVELRHAETSEPLVGAALDAETVMRSMGHQAAAPPEVLDLGDGSYRVTEVVFSMPGLWELRLSAEKGAIYDEVGLLFEVP